MFWHILAVTITLLATAEDGLDQNEKVQDNAEVKEITETTSIDGNQHVDLNAESSNDTLQLNGTDCESAIPHCTSCLSKTVDQFDTKSLDERCVDCGDNDVDGNGYWLESNASDWKCLDCKWGYAVNKNQTQCVACQEAIENCTECSNQDGEIVCSLCEEGFFLDNDHAVDNTFSCKACDGALDNCYSCQFELRGESNKLVCTGCHHGYYFDYYQNCSACNETIPRCTNCSSFEACQIFGPVQNLTCHDCEDNYYVGEDEASCKTDCRNISSLCENCTLDEDQECLSCSTGAYRDDRGNCQSCSDLEPGCDSCTDGTPSLCVSCQEGYSHHPSDLSCKGCPKHCKKCQVAETSEGETKAICQDCEVGYALAESTGDCVGWSDETRYCRNWNEDQVCTACIPGYVLNGPQCEVLVCGVPPPPSHRGGYAFTGMQYGDTVTYDCECGYDLVGDQVLTCDEIGQWGQAPCCIRKMLGLSLITLDWRMVGFNDEELLQILDRGRAGDYVKMQKNRGSRETRVRPPIQSPGESDNVRQLHLGWNRLTKMPPLTQYRQMDSLHRLNLDDNNIHSFMWEDFPARTEQIILSWNKLSVLPMLSQCDFCLNVKVLDLAKNKLVTISHEHIPPTVEDLNLRDNQLVEINDISHSKYLRGHHHFMAILSPLPTTLHTLQLDNNQLSDMVNLSRLHKLEVLHLGNNKLNMILTEFLPSSLKAIYLHNNMITKIGDLSHTDKLTNLNLRNNQLTAIPLFLPPSLREMDLFDNKIKEIGNLSHLDKLPVLELGKNELTSIPPTLPSSLTAMFLHDNRITEIGDLRHLDKLISLDLRNNQLTTIPLLLPSSLPILPLSGNRITKIGDLRYFNKLIVLELSFNQLMAIPLLLPPNLKELVLFGNNIDDWSNLTLLQNRTNLRVYH